MDLPTRLERLAGSLSVWDNGYDQFAADVRELLEEAAKKIRSDAAWIALLNNHLHQSDIRSH